MSVGVLRSLRRSGLSEMAKRPGWTVHHTRNGHLRFEHESGAVVVAGSSPSDIRGRKNLLARVKQVERGETPR